MFLCLWFVFMSERDLSEFEVDEVDETSPRRGTLAGGRDWVWASGGREIPWGEEDHCFL